MKIMLTQHSGKILLIGPNPFQMMKNARNPCGIFTVKHIYYEPLATTATRKNINCTLLGNIHMCIDDMCTFIRVSRVGTYRRNTVEEDSQPLISRCCRA